jgi:hypothetical protein
MNYVTQLLHTEVGKRIQDGFHWETLKSVVQSPMAFRAVPTEQTLFTLDKAQYVVIETMYVHPRMIHVLKKTDGSYAVESFDVCSDKRVVIEHVCCFRSHLQTIAYMTATTLYVVEYGRLSEFDHNLKLDGVNQMDFFADQHGVVVAVCDAYTVCTYRLEGPDPLPIATVQWSTDAMNSCDEITILNRSGEFMMRCPTGMYIVSPTGKFGCPYQIDTSEVRRIARLDRTRRWCVCYLDVVLFLDTRSLMEWVRTGVHATIRALEAGDADGTYINLTAPQFTITPDERACMYEYRGRLCVVQLTPPYAVYPTTVVKGLRSTFERIVAIVYFEKQACIRLFTTRGIYTFQNENRLR